MNIPDIDFTRIRSLGPGGQRDGFEQFLCRQVGQEPPSAEAKFLSLHGAGGDGGVECYWVLGDGSEHGWQAKYWTDHNDVNKRQLDKSVDAALAQHPSLTKYTIAIPTDPTGPTGGQGKSLLEKITDKDGWLDGWRSKAEARGMSVEFELEWATNLITRLERLDASGLQRRYWFDADILPAQWWADRFSDAVAAARPRYIPELTVEVSAYRAIGALCSDEDWWSVAESHVAMIDEAAHTVAIAKDVALTANMEGCLDAATAVSEAVIVWRSRRRSQDFEALTHVLEASVALVHEQESLEVAAMDAKYPGIHWDTKRWRQYQAEYEVAFPAAAVDALRGLDLALGATTEALVGPLGRLASSQIALMTGAAGVGKTFVAIDAVARRLNQGLPSVILHGRWFNDHDPLLQLRDLLHMPHDLTGEEAVGLFDEAAKIDGATTLIVIDALNDTRPRSTWRDNLDRLVSSVEKYEGLRLLVTARTHYVSQVIPTSMTLERFEHTGFQGVEFEAISEYADFYGLEPPASPPIHGEFDNPLYLRLVCEALQREGRLGLEQAAMGLGELTAMILDNANDLVSDRIDAPRADRVVHSAMNALASAIADGGPDPWLTRSQAQAVVAPIWPDRSAERSLLDALIGQGLLEEDVVPDGTTYGGDIVAITFERIGHHLIVSDALSPIHDRAGVEAELGGRLGRIIGLNSTIDVGLLEATSVVIAERFGIELAEFRSVIDDDDALAAAVVAGAAWRNPASISTATRAIVLDALRRRRTVSDTLALLFRLSVRPDHPLNADFLHEVLATKTMALRDAVLAPWYHHTHATGGSVDRLIRWAREKPLEQVGDETARLWITALLWCTSATDRRVRDTASLAAVRLLTRHPHHAARSLERFTAVDDEWIVERACAVAYAALLANGAREDWAAAADIASQNIFAAGQITPNASVRDAARSLLEAANYRDLLPAGLTPEQFRPPYVSNWPLDWPTEQEVEALDRNDYPRLVYSTTGDDFFTYQLSPALRDRPGIDLDAAARWVVIQAIRIGYEPGLHRSFDIYVINEFGDGRSTPAWIERIGKKYQWIALNRLAGIVADHIPKKRESWDPPEPPVPGPQTRLTTQMDPTVVEFDVNPDSPRPWVPEYDWRPAMEAAEADWIADGTDFPHIAFEAPMLDGRPHLVLSGAYTWLREDSSSSRQRRIWTSVYSHLVATVDLAAVIDELRQRDLVGHPVAESTYVYDGYVGDFPYGHHHERWLHLVRHEWTEPLSVVSRRATWDFLGEHEYAPDELKTISLDVPAPEFFGSAPGGLRWNGRNGWVEETGLQVATVRHVGRGQNELLMDTDWLGRWLTAERMSLVLIENSAKEAYGGIGDASNYPGRHTRSQVHSWTPGEDLRTATPGWNHTGARNA